jgi:hypothetical protein
VRVRLPYTLEVYTNLGRSTLSGDSSAGLNQLYGVALGNIRHTGLRADVHYSTFNSSYGRGHYAAFSLSRQFGETLRAEVQVGQQNFISSLTVTNSAWWIYSNLDWFVGRHSYLGAGFTSYRGGTAPYAQMYLTTGYRF